MQILIGALVLFFAGCPAQAASIPIAPAQFQGLLQRFVSFGYGEKFKNLGDERDFDHGHILISGRTGKPFAILYHTQELSPTPSAARNWLEWLDGGIEDARRYVRKDYPRSASWDWFRFEQLPKLLKRNTVTDKMLDPNLLGTDVSDSIQRTFTRVDCSGRPSGKTIKILLPDQTPVCLALGV